PGRVDPTVARGQEAKRRALASDAEVERGAQERRAAVREAVDRADERLRKRGDVPRGFVPERLPPGQLFLAEPGHFVDVGARGERAVAGAGEDDRLHGVVLFAP